MDGVVLVRAVRPGATALALAMAIVGCGGGGARPGGRRDGAPQPSSTPTPPGPSEAVPTRDASPTDLPERAMADGGAGSGPAPEAGSAGRSDVAPPADAARPAAGDGPPVRSDKLPHVILDTDTAAEVDDQHALAYLLFSADRWFIEGVTTNATTQTGTGGNVAAHTAEARRVIQLCASEKAVAVHEGASGGFADIASHLSDAQYDARDAVEFIVGSASHHSAQDKLVIVAIGKLTNVALALKKAPDVASKIRLVWLGTNWIPGKHDAADEYNEKNDYAAVNALYDSTVEMSVAVVRFGDDSGTFNIMVNETELRAAYAKGHGPDVPAVTKGGRSFTNFGDYSLYLWGNSGQRALFDVVAVAVTKDPEWATAEDIPAPTIEGGVIKARPNNARKVRFLSAFRPHRDAILADFFGSINHPALQK